MEAKERGINVNTLILGALTVLLAVAGYLARADFEEIKASQAKLWQAIMPRQEIEVRIEALKAENTRNQSDISDLRARQTTLEMQFKAKP